SFRTGHRSRARSGQREPTGLSLCLGKRWDRCAATLRVLVESSTFVTFHARNWAGLSYSDPPLFTVRSLDGRPLDRSTRIRVYHGFGDVRVRVGRASRRAEKEALISASP